MKVRSKKVKKSSRVSKSVKSSKGSGNNKKLIIIIAAVCLALVVAGVVLFLSLNKKEEPKPEFMIQGITMASTPKTTYYVGEEFDSTGARVQVQNNLNIVQFIDEARLTFDGFDSSVPNESLRITVSFEFQGKVFSTFYNVTIKPAPEDTEDKTIASIELSNNFRTVYGVNEWNNYGPNFSGVELILVYNDETTEEIDEIPPSWCSGIKKVTEPGSTEFTITYSNDGVTVQKTVEISITAD